MSFAFSHGDFVYLTIEYIQCSYSIRRDERFVLHYYQRVLWVLFSEECTMYNADCAMAILCEQNNTAHSH